jgi:hypothetical protein
MFVVLSRLPNRCVHGNQLKMKDFKEGCYRIEPGEDGDVTLHLDDDYATPENLFMAALEFLSKKPEYYLGTWVNHPDIKNVLYGAYSSGGRVPLRFYTQDSIAAHNEVEGFVYLNHATFERVINTMIKSAGEIRQAAGGEDN